MIIIETPVRTLDDEIHALENASTECTDLMHAYAVGAKRALEWVRDRKIAPSQDVTDGTISLSTH